MQSTNDNQSFNNVENETKNEDKQMELNRARYEALLYSNIMRPIQPNDFQMIENNGQAPWNFQMIVNHPQVAWIRGAPANEENDIEAQGPSAGTLKPRED
jgi:hypothetical protein